MKELYPTKSFEEIAGILHRSPRSVKEKAINVGLRHAAKTTWTSDEIEFLRSHLSDMTYAEIGEHLGRSISSVFHKAEMLNREVYTGCDCDCFHCRYSDCIAPLSVCKTGHSDVIKKERRGRQC